jgi:hypothetical protein
MTKEEFVSQGWEIICSAPCAIIRWGKYLVHLRHTSGRKVTGYGDNEEAALNDAALTIQKPLEKTYEIRH